MHSEIFAKYDLLHVAQAKGQSATAATKKAWQKASKKGQYAVHMLVGKLVCTSIMFITCISMMLLLVRVANSKVNKEFCMQQVGIYSDEYVARKGQQWQFSWRQTRQVSCACRQYDVSLKAIPRVNACNLQCKEVAQKGKSKLKANFGIAKSQKPSTVSGRIRVKQLALEDSKRGTAGLITPKNSLVESTMQRFEKIRRLAQKFRERRQAGLRLMANSKSASQLKEPIGKGEKGKMSSIDDIFGISSTSDSSSMGFNEEDNLVAGVHTGGKSSENGNCQQQTEAGTIKRNATNMEKGKSRVNDSKRDISTWKVDSADSRQRLAAGINQSGRGSSKTGRLGNKIDDVNDTWKIGGDDVSTKQHISKQKRVTFIRSANNGNTDSDGGRALENNGDEGGDDSSTNISRESEQLRQLQ